MWNSIKPQTSAVWITIQSLDRHEFSFAQDSQSPMQILIRSEIWSESGRVTVMDVVPTTTIFTLMDRILEEIGLLGNLALFYAGQRLAGPCMLSDYGISNLSTIRLAPDNGDNQN
jgi:hypothetical protein